MEVLPGCVKWVAFPWREMGQSTQKTERTERSRRRRFLMVTSWPKD